MTDLEIVKHYQTILPCRQMVLTGSTALKYYGLIDQSSDIDLIIVEPTDAAFETLKKLQEAYPAKTKPVHDPQLPSEAKPVPAGCISPIPERLSFIFMHESVKIDVIISGKPINTQVVASDIPLRPISQIIAKKKSANRMKDWLQLRALSRLFFSEEEFKTRLDGIRYQDAATAVALTMKTEIMGILKSVYGVTSVKDLLKKDYAGFIYLLRELNK